MSPSAAKPELVTHPPRAVDIAGIERALAQLWKHPEPADPKHPEVTRACMSNLLIFCSTQTQASLVTEELDEIVRLHPSRVLLLVGEAATAGATIEAFVSAHCHLAGDHGQVCSEHVTIQATGDAVRRLPSAARSLLIGDLPTSLWWASREAPPLGGELFEELAEMTDQVVFSSLSWDAPVRDTLATARWAVEPEAVGGSADDLAWRRLEPWRTLIAQSLDPVSMPGALESITRVTLEHGAHGLPQSWLLAGWLASRLGWQLIGGASRRDPETVWRFQSPAGPLEVRTRRQEEGDPEVRNVAVSWKAGGASPAMTFASNAPGKLAMTCEGHECQPRVLVAPHQSRASLVGLQLQDLDPDLVYLEALRVSRVMAEALASS